MTEARLHLRTTDGANYTETTILVTNARFTETETGFVLDGELPGEFAPLLARQQVSGVSLTCGICSHGFEPYETMRGPDTAGGQFWCQKCQDEFDSIDPDERADR